MTKKKYKITGMNCTSCAAMIELDLEDAGVKAKCSYPKSSLEVEFDPKRVDEEKIKEVIESSGYKITS